MKPKLKKQWIKALRSGKYEQGRGYLCSKDNKYCCLGVLYDLVGDYWEWDPTLETWMTHEGLSARLPYDVLEYPIQTKLMSLNDRRYKSFNEIANWIENKL